MWVEEGRGGHFWSQTACIYNPAQAFTSWMGKFLNISVPQFPHKKRYQYLPPQSCSENERSLFKALRTGLAHSGSYKGLQLLPTLSFLKCCRSQGEGRRPQSHRSWAKPKTSSQPQIPLTSSFPGSLPSFTKQMLGVSRTEVRYNFSWFPTYT